jgi:molecular chaperone GrpE
MTKHIRIQGDEDSQMIGEGTAGEDIEIASEHQGDVTSEPHEDQVPAETTPEEEIENRLQEAEQKAQDNYDRLLRVSAEFDNYKKRTAREMQDVAKYANEKLAGDLLTVVDNLERAIDSATSQCGADDPVVQGVSLVLEEVIKILDRHHVKPIKAFGEPFDPTLHQAMMQEASQEYPPNTVVREMQKGYLIHDRLLRPSLVAVSTAADNQADENE